MNTVLVFCGVGGKFGYEEGSDLVAGTTHGLKGAAKAKARKMIACRVPYEILKDKSKYFIEALAGFDNHMDKFTYDPTWLDGKKLLLKLHAAHGTDPMSSIAAEQVKFAYGLPTRQITKAQEMAVTDIEASKNPDVKWKTYSPTELKNLKDIATTDEQLAITLSSGKYYEEPIWKKFKNDDLEEGGEKRKKMKVFIHHPPNIITKENWEEAFSGHVKSIKWLLSPHGYTVEFKILDHEQDDTVESNEEEE